MTRYGGPEAYAAQQAREVECSRLTAQLRQTERIAANNRRTALEQAAISAFTVSSEERTWTREVGR